MSQDQDNALWLALWRDKQLDFHQLQENPYLLRFWPTLNIPSGSRIFVPLCGKSLDMIWLASQGFDVIGVELSPVAVKSFFKENGLQPRKRRRGAFTLWSHGRIRILCGDYFALSAKDLGNIHTVYDRAALTALPESVRKPYVAQLHRIVPDTASVFMLTVEDVTEQDPQVDREISALYGEHFCIELVNLERVQESDPASSDQPPVPTDYKVYRFTPRPANRA